VQQIAEQLARRREPTGDEVADHGAQLTGREALAVDLQLEQLGGDVVAAIDSALVDAVVDVAGELREAVG